MLDLPDQNAPGQPVHTLVDARPAAIVDGRQIPWGDLRPLLTEMAGVEAMRELLLDRAIDEYAADRGITVAEADIAAERTRLLTSLHDDPATALELLEEMRLRRGLGPVRFHRLLYRNAILRSQVQADVTITDASVQRMYRIMHGPKRQGRLILVDDPAAARRAIERVRSGEAFADVATELSIDPSAARGGLLEPIAREDPAYPEPVRAELYRMLTGEISTPIMLDVGYAVLQLHRVMPAEGVALHDVREDVVQVVRMEQERLLMDQLAQSLLGTRSVMIVDPSLRDMWNRSRTAAVQP